jgi:hypothetical protein
MLFLALIVFVIFWWPFKWLIAPSLPLVSTWIEPALAGFFYLICLPVAWLIDRFIVFASEAHSRTLRRMSRLAGTRGISVLLFAASGISLILWVLGMEMSSWFVGPLVPVFLVSGFNLLGVDFSQGSGMEEEESRTIVHSPSATRPRNHAVIPGLSVEVEDEDIPDIIVPKTPE